MASTGTWSPAGAPTNGDNLIFDGGVQNKGCTIDIAAAFGSVVTQNGYTANITVGANFSVTSWNQNSAGGTLGNTSYTVTDYGDWVVNPGKADGGNALKIIMSGTGTSTLTLYAGYLLRTLQISTTGASKTVNSTAQFTLQQSGTSTLTVDANCTLNLNANLNASTTTVQIATLTNNGVIGGSGTLYYARTTAVTQAFGAINCALCIMLSSSATANRAVTLGANTAFGGALTLLSNHATYTLTLACSNKTLSVTGLTTLSTRAVITHSAALAFTGGYTQSGASSVFTQGAAVSSGTVIASSGGMTGNPTYVWTCSGDWTSSGTFLVAYDTVRLKFTTDGSVLNHNSDNYGHFYGLQVSGNLTVKPTSVQTVVREQLIVDASKTLTIDTHSLACTSWMMASPTMGAGAHITCTNGGTFIFYLHSGTVRDFDWLPPIEGDGNVKVLLEASSNAYALNMVSNRTLGGLTVVSESATAVTLDLAGYSLTVNGITAGAGSVILGGEGVITDSGNWDTSAGTWTQETSTVIMSGATKTITLAAGQHFYALTTAVGSSITLASNVDVTGVYTQHTIIARAGYTLTYGSIVIDPTAISKHGDARFKKLAITLAETSDARMKKLGFTASKNSNAKFVSSSATHSIFNTSDARFKLVPQIGKSADARFFKPAIQLTKNAAARFRPVPFALESQARFKRAAAQVGLATDARFQRSAQIVDKVSDARYKQAGQQIGLTADARFRPPAKTKPSDARFLHVVAIGKAASARFRHATPIDKTSAARFYAPGSQVELPSDSRFKSAGQQIETASDARFKKIAQVALYSNARFKALAKQITPLSDARFLKVRSTDKHADARFLQTTQYDTASDARFRPAPKLKTADARFKAVGTQAQKAADARFLKIAQLGKQADARFRQAANQIDLTAAARFRPPALSIASTTRFKTVGVQIPLSSGAWFAGKNQLNKTADARFLKPGIQQDKVSNAKFKLVVQIGLGSDARYKNLGAYVALPSNVRFKATEQSDKSSDSRFKAAGKQLQKGANARFKEVQQTTLQGDARFKAQITTTLNAAARFRPAALSLLSQSRFKAAGVQLSKPSNAVFTAHLQVVKESDARFFKPGSQLTKPSDAKFAPPLAVQHVDVAADARFKRAVQIGVPSNARLLGSSQIAKQGAARFRATGLQAPLPSDARFKIVVQLPAVSDARFRCTEGLSIASNACFTISPQVSVPSSARFSRVTGIDSISDARFLGSFLINIHSGARFVDYSTRTFIRLHGKIAPTSKLHGTVERIDLLGDSSPPRLEGTISPDEELHGTIIEKSEKQGLKQ